MTFFADTALLTGSALNAIRFFADSCSPAACAVMAIFPAFLPNCFTDNFIVDDVAVIVASTALPREIRTISPFFTPFTVTVSLFATRFVAVALNVRFVFGAAVEINVDASNFKSIS